jgi:transposase InsO family protein
MTDQLHKRFSNNQVKSLIESYIRKEIELSYILSIMDIGRSRFFEILKKYRQNPDTFSLDYSRGSINRKISGEVEDDILTELYIDKCMIEDKSNPIKYYNYSYIKDLLLSKYGHKVSLPTIIDRARRFGFYDKAKKPKAHERQVLTNYIGELLQHDSSHHKWSPYAEDKWYLITTLDDYSRKILYADFLESETSWAHIQSVEQTTLKYGIAYSWYVDSHSIFRFVQGRDSFWRNHIKVTDEADPQFKQVLAELGIKLIYALSPQAKGKIERPYGWLQDRIVRTCAREGIKEIEDARQVLTSELKRYNSYQVHSTTGEIPDERFYRAFDERRSLFREFVIPAPYVSTKDVFALRDNRVVNAYRKISINNLELNVSGVPIRERVTLRIVPDKKSGLAEIRFWYKDKLVGLTNVKNEDLNIHNF